MTHFSEVKDFKTFYNNHEAFVRKSLYYILKNESKVDDVVQEVFLKVWKKFNSFENRSNIKTWLYRVTMNSAYDHLRKEKKHPLLNDDEQAPQEDIAARNELGNRELIKNAISLLDGKHKSVFVLFFINQVPQEEIAQTLGIALGTVKSRVSKARSQVSEYLKSQGVNYE